MFQNVLVRLISFTIFVPAVYLTFYLVSEFTVGQSPVIVGLAMISLLVSAISLLAARYAFRRGDPIIGWSAIAMYALGAVVMVFLELGYWNASILSSHATLQREGAARDGMEILAERDRQAIRAGTLAESSGEIQAKMDAQLAQPIGSQPLAMITSNCTDRQAKAYRLCGEYLELKAAHARAEAREKAEGRIWSAGTRVEQSGIKKDIFSGATAASSLLGGPAEIWAGVFSVMMMLLLMATRDLSALGAFGPSPAKRAEKVAESVVAPVAEAERVAESLKQMAYAGSTLPREEAAKPAQDREPSPKMGAMLDDIRDRLSPASEPAAASERSSGPVIPPSNGGTRAPAPKPEPKVVPLRPSADLPSFASDMFEESEPPTKRARASRKLPPGRALFWLSDCTERSNDLSVTCSEDAAWAHYLAWCKAEELKPIGRGKFLRTIEMRVGMAPTGHGFIGLVLLDIGEGEEKMRAFA